MDDDTELYPDPSAAAGGEIAGLVRANRRSALVSAVIVLVLAAGLAVVPVPMQGALRVAAEVVLILLAGVVAVTGWFHARRSMAAVRAHRPLPGPAVHLPLAIGLALAAALLIAAVLLG